MQQQQTPGAQVLFRRLHASTPARAGTRHEFGRPLGFHMGAQVKAYEQRAFLMILSGLHMGARMSVQILFANMGTADMRVDLRGGGIGMAQDFLDSAQIRSPFEHMRCIRMP